MLLRIQSRNGMKRIQCNVSDTVETLYSKVCSECGLENSQGWMLYKDRVLKSAIQKSARKTINSLKLQHGDLLYLKEETSGTVIDDQKPSSSSSTQLDSPTKKSTEQEPLSAKENIVEDEIDVELSHDPGLIHRKRDPQMCKHNAHGKCLNCSPLEPYNETYLKSLNPPVKHLSFHSYLKKLKSGASKGKFVNMEDIDCKIKAGCTEHPPWPKGICTKCQPSAVVLSQQKYRHIDNVKFENPTMMDRFLNYWRKTGHQRMGFLFGKYEKHENIPLGIRATVAAIYEPPQTSTRDSVQLLEDPNDEAVEILASYLGLRRIGWIFTDLIADEETSGKVRHLRHKDTHFLSAQECMMAAHFQNKYPNPCKDATTGKSGSKFVTVCVSGNEDLHIDYEGWQVSNQCMALLRDKCLVPTLDDPALGFIKESTSQQYIPDVFYKEKDKYGNEVTRIGRPMPIEYFLIKIPAAFPLEPDHTFKGCFEAPFPIENRTAISEIQSFDVFSNYCLKIASTGIMEGFTDFHFLLFLFTDEMLPTKHVISEICRCLKTGDEVAFHKTLEGEEWKTVEQLIQASTAPALPLDEDMADFTSQGASSGAASWQCASSGWTCKHCTFINQGSGDSCEICNLPKC